MLVARLDSLRASDVATAGGKAANLGELVAASFPVPEGFVLTTAAYARVAEALGVDARDPVRARSLLAGAAIPDDIRAVLREAHARLGDPVAVRSSATAEDLPQASFAGQQDTFLDVRGVEALEAAVRGCWASLWNERAVAYRAANGVEHERVRLAVVVQRMVDARAAGVLFTADPITGRRRRAVVDAVAGLGEALVSGRTDPDHYAVDPRGGAILERQIRGERAVLDDARLRELAAIGERVERHFGAPQDIEFAIDTGGRLWLVQSRPITTLYPLPPGAPDPEIDLRVYFSVNVAQGMFEPFTPMGLQTFRLLSAAFAARLGRPLADRAAGVSLLTAAGLRLYPDITGAIRDPLGRAIAKRLFGVMEARSAPLVERLGADPRLAPRGSRLRTLGRLAHAASRAGVPAVFRSALRHPDETRERALAEADALVRERAARVPATSGERLDAFENLLLEVPPRLFPRLVGTFAPGMLSYVALLRLFRGRASEDELRTLLRGLPHNPTTEMDLALWQIAKSLRDDPESAAALARRSPADLGAAYRAGMLPAPLQRELSGFLTRYGHRAVGEIDLGLPRWSEDPSHLLGAIANYQRLPEGAHAPDAQFAQGAAEAERTAEVLIARVHGPRRALARVLVRRVRALAGTREQPKFQMVRVFAIGRALLAPVGTELAARGRIASADDLWFLTLPEARRALAGDDLHALVASRRSEYRRELARRHVPRLLLSDGTDVEAESAPAADGGMRGTPASPGTASGPARVIRDPRGARLEPGEILVAPSTDPGWTPLFLTAGGLVMEMGGMMSHGAVVAREYGIPAVVGVRGATEAIASGQRVRVDGSAGLVSLETG